MVSSITNLCKIEIYEEIKPADIAERKNKVQTGLNFLSAKTISKNVPKEYTSRVQHAVDTIQKNWNDNLQNAADIALTFNAVKQNVEGDIELEPIGLIAAALLKDVSPEHGQAAKLIANQTMDQLYKAYLDTQIDADAPKMSDTKKAAPSASAKASNEKSEKTPEPKKTEKPKETKGFFETLFGLFTGIFSVFKGLFSWIGKLFS